MNIFEVKGESQLPPEDEEILVPDETLEDSGADHFSIMCLGKSRTRSQIMHPLI